MKVTKPIIVEQYRKSYEAVNDVIHKTLKNCRRLGVVPEIQISPKDIEIEDLYYDGNYNRKGDKKSKVTHEGYVTKEIKRMICVRDYDDFDICTHEYFIESPWRLGQMIEPLIDDVVYILKIKKVISYDTSDTYNDYTVSPGVPLKCELSIVVLQDVTSIENFRDVLERWLRRRQGKIIPFRKKEGW